MAELGANSGNAAPPAEVLELITQTNEELAGVHLSEPALATGALDQYYAACAAGNTPDDALAAVQRFLDLAVLHAAAGLVRSKQSTHARHLLETLAARHPHDIGIMIALGRVHIIEEHFSQAQAIFAKVLEISPGNRFVYGNLALLFEKMGDVAAADEAWRTGFAEGMIVRVPYTGAGKAVRVLVVTSILSGNLRYRKFIDAAHFEIIKIVAESFVDGIPLPEHDVVFQAIGDADLCGHGLISASIALAQSTAPVLNKPECVAQTGRAAIAANLATLDGVVTAKTVLTARDRLIGKDGIGELERHGLTLPCLLRSPGFHTGKHFALVQTAGELQAVASSLPRDEVFAMEYLDTSRADGTFRKYRVMAIDGRLYPLHLAISYDWKVHYFSSEMYEHQLFRDEEAAFLADMPGVLGPKVTATLKNIFAGLGLDYGGIDFTIDDEGRFVVFEANATMVILRPKPDLRWDYRRKPIERALAAAQAMITNRANFHQNTT